MGSLSNTDFMPLTIVPRMKLGTQGLEVSRMGFGCAGLSGLWDKAPTTEEACALIKQAFERGITFFDSSDVYGKDHHNELLVAEAIKQLPREKIQLATKFGLKVTPEFQFIVNGSPEYARACCEASLKRLGVDYIDLYYQHRIDTSVPIEDTMGELKKLVEEGKIKYVGLSEASPDTIRRAHAVHPLTAVQMEYSLWTRDIEDEIIPLCRELGIGIVAYSPLGIGFFAGKTNEGHARHPKFMGENIERNKVLYERHAKLAQKHGCTSPQLALSWLLHHKDAILPIPGTTKLKNLQNNLGSLTVKLTHEDLDEISKELPVTQVSGPRDRPMMAKYAWMNANTPPKNTL